MTSNNRFPGTQAQSPTNEPDVVPPPHPPMTPVPPPTTEPHPSQAKPGDPKGIKTDTQPPRDNLRELVETVVFVTILVLLLRTFVAEAFVIPTGSMAETLLGYRAFVTCPDCGYEFPVNVSEELEPRRGNPDPVTACTCPNCRRHIKRQPQDRWIRNPVFLWNSGDRVLVAKWPMQEFNRWDVVVFKFPVEPIAQSIPQNYIKRLTGLPGETLAIHDGDLYVATEPIDYSNQEQPADPDDARLQKFMYFNANNAQEAFRAGKFRILRKPPPQILTMRRIVFDNDHQPVSLNGIVEPRWQTDGQWAVDDQDQPRRFTANSGEHWLRYQHNWVEHGPGLPKPIPPIESKLIQNIMGYNTFETANPGQDRFRKQDEDRFWVGDLIIECRAEITKPTGELILDLAEGDYRYQAVVNAATGECRLLQVGPVSTTELAKAATDINKSGNFSLRFANVDQRLTLWIDGKLVFGDGVEYVVNQPVMPNPINDKRPARIGIRGDLNATISQLKLWRDTYYAAPGPDRNRAPGEADVTMYIQPGHYLCMGDNSTQSSDGREWGLVPDHLMLGQAVMVYFPFWPFSNRFGPIR